MSLTGPIRHRTTGAVIHSGKGSLYKERLEQADLAGADLRRAQLGCASLDGADLRKADLSGAKLDCASLKGADLRRADLENADLSMAKLEGADLRGANLRRARLWQAHLDGARLEGADLRGAQFLFDGGLAYHAHVRSDQLLRSRLSGEAADTIRRRHRWRLRWLAVRWWLAAAVVAAAAAWYGLGIAG